MLKRFFLIFPTVLWSLIIFSLFLIGCAFKDKNTEKSLFVGILGLVSSFSEEKKTAEETSSGSSAEFEVLSVSKEFVFESANFTLEGKNLDTATGIQLFGDGFSKFLKIIEVSSSKIVVTVLHCSDSPFVVFPFGDKGNQRQISIPCLGSFRYSLRSLLYEQGVGISPLQPQFNQNSLELLRTLGDLEFISEPALPEGIQINKETGEISGIPLETTGNEFRSFQIVLRVKTNPSLKIESQLKMIVVSEEEKFNRTCRSISQTSTCKGPSPHLCSNSSICYISQFGCLTDPKCGFSE
ncbi:hypothetical protein ND861_17430 [Leptospira sp. 2 VSF19]|uniref:Lipoprotein n=1 Tax=Leptospira soteropolitanensis TaxID=2950025 RepID=A0AAW5VKE5_9LEPT|nr:hypothetical protein [Leptospira soteropolitanensis]MCW7494432.1 hypothetical protein [Leptospira soteropolitanensis]MCW7502026.1 hypothetical protein [Leptospira soteropolitanensis]MCW7524278.1 hypothetical protein [Leptospira soteropolitanensis]MCW7528143.1 hypothetical protein [Leptospira soteropolitanensis]MCW7531996.1 hypothetical protein [Leptospira soteropolitanensis]